MENNPFWDETDGEIHCIQHVETLPEAITWIQAQAELNAESQAWILNDLAEKYYEAYLHTPLFHLAPGLAQVSAGCSGRRTSCNPISVIAGASSKLGKLPPWPRPTMFPSSPITPTAVPALAAAKPG